MFLCKTNYNPNFLHHREVCEQILRLLRPDLDSKYLNIYISDLLTCPGFKMHLLISVKYFIIRISIKFLFRIEKILICSPFDCFQQASTTSKALDGTCKPWSHGKVTTYPITQSTFNIGMSIL